MKNLMMIATAAAAMAGLAGSAQAANYLAQSGFGQDGNGFAACRTGSSTNAFATGTQLSAADYDSGCIGAFDVAIDTVAQTITLNNFEAGNYSTGFLEITGITGITINALSTVSVAGFFDPNYFGDPASYGGMPTPQLSFTGNSIRILFTTEGQSPEEFTYSQQGKAVFSYAASGAVPEPASWALMLGGFGMIGGAMRSRRKAAVSFG